MSDSSLPGPDDYEYRLLGWFREAIEEGDGFLQAQNGYSKIPDAIKAIMGEEKELRVANLSQTRANHVGKLGTDLTAALTDIKPFWEYKTANKRYESHTNLYGKISQHIWLQQMLDLKFAEVVKF